jgi:hypothetical protein
VFQLVNGRLSETENLAALRINSVHDVADSAVLAGGVHPLKNQQQRTAVRGVMKVLQRTQFGKVRFQKFLIPFFDLQKGFTFVGHFFSAIFSPGRTRKSLDLIFIFKPRVRIQAAFHFAFRFDNASKPEITSNNSSSIPA